MSDTPQQCCTACSYDVHDSRQRLMNRVLASHCLSVAGAESRLPAACISLSPCRSLCCSGATHGKPLSNPANHPHSRRCHSQHSAAPTAVLHSPPRHQVVLHMYQPTVLNSLVLETLADLWHWVEQLPETERRTDPICRVREALRVLELDTSRDARRQLQALLKSWDMTQQDPSNKKKRSVVEVHQRLRAAVLKEGNRLRTMVSFSSRASFENLFRSSAAQRAARTSRRARSRSARR